MLLQVIKCYLQQIGNIMCLLIFKYLNSKYNFKIKLSTIFFKTKVIYNPNILVHIMPQLAPKSIQGKRKLYNILLGKKSKKKENNNQNIKLRQEQQVMTYQQSVIPLTCNTSISELPQSCLINNPDGMEFPRFFYDDIFNARFMFFQD